MPAAEIAAVERAGAVQRFPETVVAVTLFEIRERSPGVGQGARITRLGDQRQANKVAAGQLARLVESEVGHQRHAMIFDLPVTQDASALGVIERHRPQQELPVACDHRRAVAAEELQELLAVCVIGRGERCAIGGEPLDRMQALAGASMFVPESGISASEAEQRLLRERQRQVLGGELDDQDDNVYVVEEIQFDGLGDKGYGRRRRVEVRPHRSDVVAAENADR